VTHRVIDLTDRLGPQSAEIAEESHDLGAPSLPAAVEALLLIADEPMSAEDLGVALNTPPDEITSTVEGLQSEYATLGPWLHDPQGVQRLAVRDGGGLFRTRQPLCQGRPVGPTVPGSTRDARRGGLPTAGLA
jgi:segregation and condensation protein B